MDAEKDVTRIVRTWLRTDDRASADAVLERVLFELDTTPQHRAWNLVGTLGEMGRRARLAVALASAALVVIVAGSLWRALDGPAGVGASPSTPSTVRPSSSTAAGRAPQQSVLPGGRVRLGDGGIRFSIEVPGGWEGFADAHDNYIGRSVVGPQGAEAVIFWTTYPAGGRVAYECHYLRSRPAATSATELAALVAQVSGTEVVSGPADLTIDGLPAKRVTILVREDVGCDPGFFFTYPNGWGGALWPETEPGDMVTVWIVDVRGELLFLEAKTKPDAGAGLIEQIETIVGSIQFE